MNANARQYVLCGGVLFGALVAMHCSADSGAGPDASGGGGSKGAGGSMGSGGSTDTGGSLGPDGSTDAGGSLGPDGSTDAGGPPGHATTCEIPTPWPEPNTPATVVGDGTVASCTTATLQAAVDKGGLVTFNCGSGNVTIAVTSTVNTPGGTTILDGAGKITLDGGGTTQILKMGGGAKLSVRNLTLQNGYLGDAAMYGGAAIGCSWGNQLEIINCTITANHAPRGGGGAIMAGPGGALTIVGSTLTKNSGPYGGAVYNLLAPLTIVNSTFESNVGKKDPDGGGGNGAAIVTDGAGGGAISMCGVKFLNNEAENGSPNFWWTYGPDSVIVKQSTFQGNVGHGGYMGGGFLAVISQPDGATPGTFLVEDSSFIENMADLNGGAIAVGCYGPCNIKNSTFYGNNTHQSGAAISGHQDLKDDPTGVHLSNVTFAHNGDQFGSNTLDGSKFVINNTAFHSSGSQLCSSTDNTGSNVRQFMSGDLTNAAPCIPGAPATVKSDPFPSLADSGGPTFTAMPVMNAGGSLLVGAGSGCEATDQRGVSRDVSKCTIGAVEVTSQ